MGSYLYIFISRHVSPDGETWGKLLLRGVSIGNHPIFTDWFFVDPVKPRRLTP